MILSYLQLEAFLLNSNDPIVEEIQITESDEDAITTCRGYLDECNMVCSTDDLHKVVEKFRSF